MRVSITCVFLVALFAAPVLGLTVFDFESGKLDGWTMTGNLTGQPVTGREGLVFNKEGRYFIGTYEVGQDGPTGELKSPTFKIESRVISLLVGGGNYPRTCYVALSDAVTGEALRSETGSNTETMVRRFWDVKDLIGRQVYILIVDHESGGWGHINADDIRELAPDEVAEYERHEAAKEAEYREWLASAAKPSPRKVYRGRETEDLAMPMGGIGSGSIALCGDGALREWQIWNRVNSACVLPGSFFAIKAGEVAKALQRPAAGGLPGVATTEFIGEFPIAEIAYKDPDLPVQVSLQAFSPFIPLNAQDSGLPAVTYTFTVKNQGRKRVSVGLAACLQNAVGYDGLGKIDGVSFPGYGGNVSREASLPGCRAILMTGALDPSDRLFGTMTLAAMAKHAAWGSWTTDDEFKSLLLGAAGKPIPGSPTPKGRTSNGVLIVPVSLAPRESKQVTFVIAWHFPNRHADYDGNLAKYRIGNYYNTRFKDSAEVARYVIGNFRRLARETRLFRDTFYSSNLPYHVLDRISSQASTLTCQTAMWIEDGTLAMFEGGGCCPMNCTHVYNYEQTLSCLFPDLERNMRRTDLFVQQDASGFVHHRTVLPLDLPRGSGAFVDGHLGTILKSYREHLRSPDSSWLRSAWPRIKLAMDYVLGEWDKDNDGVLLGEQWNTYDAAMYGPNTFIGTLYLCALRAAQEMAKAQGDAAFAARCRRTFDSGSKRLNDALWNGEYYIHVDGKAEAQALGGAAAWMLVDWPKETLDPWANRPYGSGCHADQFLGQWWADILGLGYLLPKDRVNAGLGAIMKYNWRRDFGRVPQQRTFAFEDDKGLLNCTWPKGGRPKDAIVYADEVWTGIEYEVAALFLWEGRAQEAFQIVKAVSDRYNGVARPSFKRNPWNEIECGEHYARAMSSWSVLLAAQGARYSGPDGLIGFAPRWRPDDHRSFFTAAEGWGTFEQRRTSATQTNTITVVYGKVPIKTLSLEVAEGSGPTAVAASVDGRDVRVSLRRDGSSFSVTFDKPLVLREGQKLKVTIGLSRAG